MQKQAEAEEEAGEEVLHQLKILKQTETGEDHQAMLQRGNEVKERQEIIPHMKIK
jgi:hypothetical protein